MDDHRAQICTDTGQWGTAIDCEYLCLEEDGFCGADSRFVFVTSEVYSGDLGGLSGADAKCSAHAMAGWLGGTYKAWLSDASASPNIRFDTNGGPYLLVDNVVIANNWDELTSGSLRHPIDLNESGGAAPDAVFESANGCGPTVAGAAAAASVWSGSWSTGDHWGSAGYCDGWTNANSTLVAFGHHSAVDSAWAGACSASGGPGACSAKAPLYCFQQ
jgi:hypothetical protein